MGCFCVLLKYILWELLEWYLRSRGWGPEVSGLQASLTETRHCRGVTSKGVADQHARPVKILVGDQHARPVKILVGDLDPPLSAK